MIKKYALAFVVIFLLCELADAQSFYRRNRKTGYQLTLGIGTASYHGDLKQNQINLDAKPTVSGAIEFPIKGRFNLRGEATWYKISSDDKDEEQSGRPFTRNLSFKSSNFEFAALGVFQITPTGPRPRTNLTTYLLGGIGGTLYNPKAEYNGEDYKLRPLQTEGEDYGKIALVLPVGAGFNYRINYDWSLGLEAVYRFTTTDYLDDVSKVYLGVDAFPNGSIAQTLSDRRPEIGLEPWPAGHIRGNSSDNDGYLIVMVKTTYHFNQGLYYKRKKRRPSKIWK